MKNISVKALVCLFILLFSLTAVLAGCGGDKKPAAPATTPQASPGVTLRLGYTHNADEFSSIHLVAVKFQQLLKDKGVDVKLFPASQLGGDRDMHEQMRLGSLDMNICGTATVADKFAKIAVLDLPYLWKDYNHVHKVIDGQVGKALAEDLRNAVGLRVLAFPDSFGFRNVATTKKPVKTLEDMKNLKLRTIGTPTYIGTFKALGAAPVAMGFGEVYTSMQTGVLDGWEHEPPTLYSSKTYEVAKFVAKTDHLYGVLMMLISEKTWAKLNDAQKAAVSKAAQEATEYGRKLAPEKITSMYKALADKGMTVTEVDKTAYAKATQSFKENWVKENKVDDLYKQIVDAAK